MENNLRCLCKIQEIKELKVKGDVGADPVWCHRCNCNFDIEEIPIRRDLKFELMEWIGKYGEWIDWERDGIVPNGIELEEDHNKEGLKLTEKLQKELEGKYKVSFTPSTFSKAYK
ncbi:hypothetical protein LCL89_04170 [Halobacillus yeomjeoni]|uniref:hypothetical protein n=1 Tax=Halobacillus yeomjeoni TaxID=311194 RepID=UPI001CD4ED6D|nr:hypothetical protein [Halobacillus yeomjeoni]MCA0983244.1 hypothetical protein [Halobacillus yeomjeoni]